MSDTIIWMLLFFIFIIIIGLYLSDSTPLDLTEKENILNESIENFAPDISTSVDQSEGTSALYGWDVPDNKNYKETPPACDKPPPPKRCTVTPPPAESCPDQSCVPRPNNVNNLNDIMSQNKLITSDLYISPMFNSSLYSLSQYQTYYKNPNILYKFKYI